MNILSLNLATAITDSFSDVLVELVKSGFGQAVIVIVIVAIVFMLVSKLFRSSNHLAYKILDQFTGSNKNQSDDFDLHSCEDKIRELEKKTLERESRLKELEKLPDEVKHLSDVIEDVRKIVEEDGSH